MSNPNPPAPLLLDLSHTSHTRARTGIQRVCRALFAALGERAIPLTFDPQQRAWRNLQQWERNTLSSESAASQRGAQWPLAAKLRGHARRVLGSPALPLPANAGLLVPELFSPAVARALPALFACAGGPRVAVFHDAIALQFPDLTPTKTVARFPAYLRELLGFDGIAAISDASRASLLDYWQWLGVRDTPPVQTISLAVDPFHIIHENAPEPAGPPIVLSVGSIEGRKNHLALLEACEALWGRGVEFTLHLIGLAQTQTGGTALARIRALQAAGRSLRYDGAVSDAAVAAAYAACAFTVYPSLIEGFGLPVLESLAHGKPCICSGRGALGEAARGGGGVALESVGAPALEAAIARLLASPAERAQLSAAGRARHLKKWTDYVAELDGWMLTLSRRS